MVLFPQIYGYIRGVRNCNTTVTTKQGSTLGPCAKTGSRHACAISQSRDELNILGIDIACIGAVLTRSILFIKMMYFQLEALPLTIQYPSFILFYSYIQSFYLTSPFVSFLLSYLPLIFPFSMLDFFSSSFLYSYFIISSFSFRVYFIPSFPTSHYIRPYFLDVFLHFFFPISFFIFFPRFLYHFLISQFSL